MAQYREAHNTRPPGRSSRALLSALFLSTGAALLVYILSGISLLAAVTLVLGGAAIIGATIWRRSSTPDHAELRRAVRAGAFAGLLATVSYDFARCVLVEVAHMAFWPFDIFTIFGQALVGSSRTGLLVTLAGAAYHVTNGVAFAIAYTILAGRRGVWAGIGWALALETVMVTIYPGWLGVKALDEFISVSVFGHVVYGSVLGFTARRLLSRDGNTEDGEHG
jgi:hypothetical protein